ncbi:DUF3703 domain-containing protein [Acidovorax lacteus]|uniref:DUF3703 domain-containing protein n=1 Tax=Acidovorax lacteus TaxID=1924988 RepID=A0ABP8KXA6_9BURK
MNLNEPWRTNDPQAHTRAVEWLLAQGRATDSPAAERWRWLEAAHVLGQPVWRLHARTHAAMARQAFADRDARECGGQWLRWILTVPGHALRRLPAGNLGRARISPFASMEVPAELTDRIRQALVAANAVPPSA